MTTSVAERDHQLTTLGLRSVSMAAAGCSAAVAGAYLAIDATIAAAATLLCSLAFAAVRLLVAPGRVQVGVLALVAVAVVGFVASSYELGGLNSPALLWVPLLLRASYGAAGRRVTIVASVLCAIAILIIATFDNEPVVSAGSLNVARCVSALLAVAMALLGARNHEEYRKLSVQSVEETSRAKSELLANVSHELRTPLHIIVGMSSELLQTKLNDEQRDDLRVVRGSAEALVVLVDDLLDTSRLEAGRVALASAPFDPAAVAHSVFDLLALRARDKKLSFELDIQPGMPRVIGDAGRVRQVLTNLVDNALKFSEAGKVVVRLALEAPPHAALEGERDAAQLRFVVEDSGIGVPRARKATAGR